MSKDLDRFEILNAHVSALHKLMVAHRATSSKTSPTAAAQPTPGPLPRSTVVSVVIDTLRVAHIREKSSESTELTADFRRVEKEDTHLGRPGFRIGLFLDLLHQRLSWFWVLGPGELLNGNPSTPGEIADRILATA